MFKCPVCEGEAKDITVQTFDGRTISCTACGIYDVSGTIYDTGLLTRKDPDERANALAKAKAKAEPGKRPMITSHDL